LSEKIQSLEATTRPLVSSTKMAGPPRWSLSFCRKWLAAVRKPSCCPAGARSKASTSGFSSTVLGMAACRVTSLSMAAARISSWWLASPRIWLKPCCSETR
jgi:hypothetical protein